MSDEAQVPGNVEILDATVRIVASYLAGNAVPADKIPEVISTVGASLQACASGITSAALIESKPVPPVSIRKSVQSDFIICLEDGLKFKSLKRHLRTKYGLTPDQYRAKWDLPADYPMTAPNYAIRRSEIARAVGLGRQKA